MGQPVSRSDAAWRRVFYKELPTTYFVKTRDNWPFSSSLEAVCPLVWICIGIRFVFKSPRLEFPLDVGSFLRNLRLTTLRMAGRQFTVEAEPNRGSDNWHRLTTMNDLIVLGPLLGQKN
jgi:hypothetical protein